MSEKTDLVDYYAKRANEYERIDQKSERQTDLAALRGLFRQVFAGHRVLEIACGTGYWTQVVAETAKSITATDINEEVLQIARAKNYAGNVSFQKADALNLSFPRQDDFTAGLAAAWWSHLRKAQIRNFLFQFHRLFSPGSIIVFMDNRFVPGSNTPISRTDAEGNSYQVRRFENGDEHEILKNFPSEKEVREVITDLAVEISRTELQYYWFLTYKLK
jgi:demethylmenaquinone methyltransferase/2-methoxy-6-polyprenyl-1,4-benzoquinol methylase